MHILVLGAAGMVGRKLTERLLRDGRLGKQDITRMTLQDVVAPATPAKVGFPVEIEGCHPRILPSGKGGCSSHPFALSTPSCVREVPSVVHGNAKRARGSRRKPLWCNRMTPPGLEPRFLGREPSVLGH